MDRNNRRVKYLTGANTTFKAYGMNDEKKKKRLCQKPGLTGVWQVSGRSTITDFEEIVQMDVDYIDHWSIWRDIGILFKTVWLVVCGDDGAQ